MILFCFCTVIYILMGKTDSAVVSWNVPSIPTASGSATETVPEYTGYGDVIIDVDCISNSSGTFTYNITDQPASEIVELTTATLVTASGKSFDFETEPIYVLTVTDGKKYVYYKRCTDISDGDVGTATITLNVTDANDRPMFLADQYSAIISDKATSGTKLITVSVVDEDGDGITLDLLAGNTNLDFEIDQDGTIKVATGQTLDQSIRGGYELLVRASDDNPSGVLTGTATVWVAVTSCDSGASVVFVGPMTLVLVIFGLLV